MFVDVASIEGYQLDAAGFQVVSFHRKFGQTPVNMQSLTASRANSFNKIGFPHVKFRTLDTGTHRMARCSGNKLDMTYQVNAKFAQYRQCKSRFAGRRVVPTKEHLFIFFYYLHISKRSNSAGYCAGTCYCHILFPSGCPGLLPRNQNPQNSLHPPPCPFASRCPLHWLAFPLICAAMGTSFVYGYKWA